MAIATFSSYSALLIQAPQSLFPVDESGKRRSLAEVKKEHVEKLVVKKATLEQITGISKRVEKILAAKKENPSSNTNALEQEIDQQVYALTA